MRAIWVVMLLGCGCITPYQPAGATGGYRERKEAPGVFRVQVFGNGYTGGGTLESYLWRRGRELCTTEGYSHVGLKNKSERDEPYVDAYGTSYKRSVSATVICMTDDEWQAMQDGRRERLLGEQ